MTWRPTLSAEIAQIFEQLSSTFDRRHDWSYSTRPYQHTRTLVTRSLAPERPDPPKRGSADKKLAHAQRMREQYDPEKRAQRWLDLKQDAAALEAHRARRRAAYAPTESERAARRASDQKRNATPEVKAKRKDVDARYYQRRKAAQNSSLSCSKSS